MRRLHRTLWSGLLTALFAAAAAAPAMAQTKSFRCRNDLVNLGDSRASALLKCGEPVVKDAFCKPVQTLDGAPVALVPQATAPSVPGRAGTTVNININVNRCESVDEWTYNPGYGQFLTTLRFESGMLTEIRYGDRVK